MKKRLPAILTIVLLLAVLLVLTQRERWREGASKPTAAAASPEDVIWQMSDAAREGQTQAYLACFSGELRTRLEKTAREMGAAKFTEYLQQLNQAVTGIAVSDLEQSEADTAKLRVEFVLRGKHEAQTHHFQRVNGQWTITRVDDAEQVKVLIPYGTPVDEAKQEGERK
jgi:hypothetical protein